jgi:hypothetical protein
MRCASCKVKSICLEEGSDPARCAEHRTAKEKAMTNKQLKSVNAKIKKYFNEMAQFAIDSAEFMKDQDGMTPDDLFIQTVGQAFENRQDADPSK